MKMQDPAADKWEHSQGALGFVAFPGEGPIVYFTMLVSGLCVSPAFSC